MNGRTTGDICRASGWVSLIAHVRCKRITREKHATQLVISDKSMGILHKFRCIRYEPDVASNKPSQVFESMQCLMFHGNIQELWPVVKQLFNRVGEK